MRMPALLLIVTAAALLIAPASPQDGVNLSRKDESAKKIKELQKERIAVVKEMADQTNELYKRGQVSFEVALEARLLVFEAELDAADKESDRIALYKNIVDRLKQYEKLAAERAKAARGTQASLLTVRARRLKAEIDLERARAREAK